LGYIQGFAIGKQIGEFMRIEHKTVSCFAAVSWCLLVLHDLALAQGSANPRITSTVEIIRKIEGGVVAIFSQGQDGMLHCGSGSIIHPAGFILTNDHVVRDRPGVVLLNDREAVRYQTVGRLPEKDLAVVRISVSGKLTVIPLGHSDDLMTGEPCLCGGNPGGRGIVFTSGIVSSPAIMVDAPNALVMTHFASDVRDRFIQFDAAVNPGNSGGPLINAEGRQIGIICTLQRNEQNICYAIPVDRIRKYFEELIAPEITRNLYAGITVDPLARKAKVSQVAHDSPADVAGIQSGDVLSTANKSDLRDSLDWLLQLATNSAGDEVAVKYFRAEEEKSTSIQLASCPTQQAVVADDAVPGLEWKLYLDGKLDDLPEFDNLKPAANGITSELKTRELAGERKEHFAIRFEGFLNIKTDGLHRLILASDDGSRLFLHDSLLINNGGPHPRQELSAKARLAKGLHPIRIDYFEATGDYALELFVEDPGGNRRKLSDDAFFHRSRGDT
jgi:S1-C subfamily serine protease